MTQNVDSGDLLTRREIEAAIAALLIRAFAEELVCKARVGSGGHS